MSNESQFTFASESNKRFFPLVKCSQVNLAGSHFICIINVDKNESSYNRGSCRYRIIVMLLLCCRQRKRQVFLFATYIQNSQRLLANSVVEFDSVADLGASRTRNLVCSNLSCAVVR